MKSVCTDPRSTWEAHHPFSTVHTARKSLVIDDGIEGYGHRKCNQRFWRLVYLFFLIPLFSSTSPQRSVEVYVFMGEECIISQYYTLTLKQLWIDYAGESIHFKGLFPNPSSSPEKIKAFQDKYQLPFSLSLDLQQENMHRFGVKVTPEVVVFDKGKQEILYQGRIDNTYFRVGKRRTITTRTELEEVLHAVQANEKPIVQNAPAVGCLITKLKLLSSDVPMCKPLSKQ